MLTMCDVDLLVGRRYRKRALVANTLYVHFMCHSLLLTSLIVNISHFSLCSTNLSILPFEPSILVHVIEQDPDTAGRVA